MWQSQDQFSSGLTKFEFGIASDESVEMARAPVSSRFLGWRTPDSDGIQSRLLLFVLKDNGPERHIVAIIISFRGRNQKSLSKNWPSKV